MRETISTQEYLQHCLAKGVPWVAFEGDSLEVSPGGMWAFKTSIEAMHFCRTHAYIPDAAGDRMRKADFRFFAVGDLLVAFEHDNAIRRREPLRLEGNLQKVKKAIFDQDIIIGPPGQFETSCLLLSLGYTVTALHIDVVRPTQHLVRYHVLRHTSDLPDCSLELGHGLIPMGIHLEHASALRQFESLQALLPTQNGQIAMELLLVGQFRGVDLDLDEAGRPLGNTGFLLQTFRREVDGSQRLQLFDPSKRMELRQEFFIRFDDAANRITALDERLQPLRPIRLKQSLADAHFGAIVSDWFFERVKQRSNAASLTWTIPRRFLSEEEQRQGLGL